MPPFFLLAPCGECDIDGFEGVGRDAPLTFFLVEGGRHALDQTQPAFPVYHRRFGNPGTCYVPFVASSSFAD